MDDDWEFPYDLGNLQRRFWHLWRLKRHWLLGSSSGAVMESRERTEVEGHLGKFSWAEYGLNISYVYIEELVVQTHFRWFDSWLTDISLLIYWQQFYIRILIDIKNKDFIGFQLLYPEIMNQNDWLTYVRNMPTGSKFLSWFTWFGSPKEADHWRPSLLNFLVHQSHQSIQMAHYGAIMIDDDSNCFWL